MDYSIRMILTIPMLWVVTRWTWWVKRKTWECAFKAARQYHLAYTKANRVLGLIARTISYKSYDVLLKLYKTLLRPHLEYCVSTWSPHYIKDKSLLERVQHRFTRMVPGLKSLPYEERLERLRLWSLEKRRNRADLLEVFKMYKGLSLLPFDHFFTLNTVTTTRGHRLQPRS